MTFEDSILTIRIRTLPLLEYDNIGREIERGIKKQWFACYRMPRCKGAYCGDCLNIYTGEVMKEVIKV